MRLSGFLGKECTRASMLARRAPINPLGQVIITVHEFPPSSVPERGYHRISQFDDDHLQISFLCAWIGTRVLETGSSRVISLSSCLISSSNLISQLSFLLLSSCLISVIVYIIIVRFDYYIQIMINIKLIIAFLLLTATLSIRQSDLGVNDWSKQNIGQISQLSFPAFNAASNDAKAARQSKNIFYYSQLGLFGHLDKKTGTILSRQSLGPGEVVIESDEKQLVILTSNRQIVRYNKYSMNRAVDNRFFSKDTQAINSYVQANNKIYIADSASIKEFDPSLRKVQQLSSVPSTAGSVYLKVFAQAKQSTSTLYALTYNPPQGKVCLNQITSNQLKQVKCLNAKLGQSRYVQVFEQNGDIYFGDNQNHLYLNFATLKAEKFNSKPISFSSSGALLENGLTFASRGISEDSLVRIQCNNCGDRRLYGQEVSGHFVIYSGTDQSKGDKIGSINLQNKEFKVKKVWVNMLTENELELVVQYQDLQLVFYTQQGRQYKQVWSRQQSLAYVHKVLFMKYEGYADRLNNPYHMKMDDPHYINLTLTEKIAQIPVNMIARVKAEFEDIYNFIIQKVDGTVKTFTNPQSFQQLLDVKGYLKSKMSEQKQKKYGLRKYIIVITQYDTMFSIDSKTSAINWKKKFGIDSKLITLIKLKQQYEKEIAVAISYKYHITYLTQIHEDGSMTELEDFQTVSEPTVHKISAHSLLLRAGEKVSRYDVNKQLFGNQKQYSFYSIEDKKVIGWKVVNQDLIQTWSLELPATQSIISTTAAYRGQPQANLPLVNDKKVLFKNVDFSNLAILTMQEYTQQTAQSAKQAHRLHIYMVNGLTGIVQFSEYQTGINPNLPINLVYDEHNAIVTYYNTRNRVYEIWTIEAFQLPLESQLISKKYQPEFQKQDIVFRTKVYGTVLPIKHLFISQSKQALLKRNLIIITRQNKLYSLPRELISTRRPKTADADANANSPDSQFISSKYPPEQYILPVNTLTYLNYNKKQGALDYIRFSSSDLESTIFMMAYGIDIFLIRSSPDKAFDMLADGFNYAQLVAILIGVTIAALFFRDKVREAKLRKAHLD